MFGTIAGMTPLTSDLKLCDFLTLRELPQNFV